MPRIKAISWVGLGLLSLGAVLCAGTLPPAAQESPAASRAFDLPPEKPVRNRLSAGESHHYRLPLAPGEVVDVTVEQDGVDVSVSLLGPDGEALLSMDTPKGTRGTERLFALAETAGVHRLRVQAVDGRGGYSLRLVKPRPIGPGDRLRAQAWREYDRGERLRRQSTGEGQRRALLHYDSALRLWRTLGNREQQAIVLYRRAGILRDLTDLPQAVGIYERALVLAEDPWLRLSILNLLARFYNDLGDTQNAFLTCGKALELAPRVGDPELHAAALNNLGLIYRRWGETEKALESFKESLVQWEATGRPSAQRARTLSNQAETLLAIGHPERAVEILRESLRVLEKAGVPGEGEADRLLGVAFDQLGSPNIALVHLDMAREKAQKAKNLINEAQALNDKGTTLLRLGDLEQARAAFAEAGQIARKDRHLDNEAFSLSGLGVVQLKQGNAAGALPLFSQAEKLWGQLGDSNALAQVLHGRALAERSQGRLEDALTSTGRALDLVEELRNGVGQDDLRLHVIGARADLYDLRVDLLLRLHERTPDQELDAEAFAASEWRRARSLLDMVRKMGEEIPRDLPQESLRLQGDLRVRLQRLAQEKLKIVSGVEKRGHRDLSEIQREIQEAVTQWEDLSDQMRRQSPAYAATALKLVGVREVQALLDRDTALIAYTVGEERSFLWWIEQDALKVFQNLPPKEKLEKLAGEAYDLLSKPVQTKQRGRRETVLGELGTSLLGPVADRLGRVRRIAVVADETLQALPFAVLPVPGSGKPLVESHAVVQLPSASLAAALRARQQGRATPPKVIAVFDDPVFGPSDSRFRQGRGKPGSPGSFRPGELPRLLESAREAETVLEWVSPAKSLRLTGFAANRHAALDRDLRLYRYIHFAAHGLVDLETPSLSGIQLSGIDAQGRPLDGGGILPFYEIYNQSFPADLVTLSTCRSAVGPRVRGEGPLGMSRSFLYAGASRVIGTLWNVDDRDAANLMILFYQSLLRNGKSPAVALQEAQKEMRAQSKEYDPYRWAGFVLQGDWR